MASVNGLNGASVSVGGFPVAAVVGSGNTAVSVGNGNGIGLNIGSGIKTDKTSSSVKVHTGGLSDKKILMLGDSIMGNDRVNGVPDYVRKFTGATVYNGGLAGTCLCKRTEVTSSICLDLPNLIDAMIEGDMSEQLNQAEKLAATGSFLYFPETIKMLSELDLHEIDLITIAYGTNDWRRAHTQEYILSELKYVIDRLQLYFPLSRILVITPIYRYFGTQDGDGDSDTRTNFGTTKIGYTLKQLTLDIEQTAKDKRVSSLNAYQEMQLSRNNAESYFDEGDKTHINQKGNEMYGHLIAGKIFDMFGCICGGTDNRQYPDNTGDASALPTVTEEDNGKVLKVQSGQWSAAEDECRPLSNLEIEKLLNNFT